MAAGAFVTLHKRLFACILASVAGLSSAPIAHAADIQRVVLDASFVDLIPERVVATVQQDGASREIVLVDDGSNVDDAAGDRVWTGSAEGEPAQYLPIRLAVTVDDVTRDVYAGVVRVGNERTVEVAFEVMTTPQGALVGARRTSASPGRVTHATEAVPLLAASFWSVLLLVLGALALRRGRAPVPPQ